MARLIDADEVDYENIACSQSQLHWLHRIIEMQPTVDAVEVVRCGECRHLMFSDFYGECRQGCLEIVKPDDFCPYGERILND